MRCDGRSDDAQTSGDSMTTKLVLLAAGPASFWLLLTANTMIVHSAAADSVSTTLPEYVESYVCPVASPDGHERPNFPHNGTFRSDGTYGNDSLYTILGSMVTFKPGSGGMAHADGSHSMKYMWWRLQEGKLTIGGRRLDGPAPPLRARIPDGYGNIGFQATGLIFPTTGCWEVTGRVGDGSLVFVVLVDRVGDGPCWKEVRPDGETGGRVTTTAWVEEPFAESAGDVTAVNVSGERKYTGGNFGIRGSSDFQFRLTPHPDQSATFIGTEKITGSVNGKNGSFTIRHTGKIEEGIARSSWVVLESSGTGELSKIAGHGAYSSGLDEKACYSIAASGI